MKRHDCKINESLIEAMVDGELEESRRVKIEEDLADCERCRSLARGLTEMGDLLRVHTDAIADSMDFDSLWPAIESKLEAEGAFELDPLQLQAFADGELEGRDLIKTADSLARSDIAHRRIDAITELGDLLRVRMEEAADSVEFGAMWQRLDEAVGAELEKQGELTVSRPSEQVAEQAGWFDRIIAAIGGYRAVLMSAVTAALVVILLLPMLLNGNEESVDGPVAAHPETLEIRVVHVNEVVSNQGHQVTVEPYDGYAPVIYIRAEGESAEDDIQPQPEEHDGGLYDNPI